MIYFHYVHWTFTFAHRNNIFLCLYQFTYKKGTQGPEEDKLYYHLIRTVLLTLLIFCIRIQDSPVNGRRVHILNWDFTPVCNYVQRLCTILASATLEMVIKNITVLWSNPKVEYYTLISETFTAHQCSLQNRI